ncbi:hypothetical protein ACNOYE_36830 [Nannocystaceae bacterium ST9]
MTVDPPREPPRPAATLTGSWSPLPGRVVGLAATDDALFLAEVPDAGEPTRVHVVRWREGRWQWQTTWDVPRPPSVAADHDLSGSGAWIDVVAHPEGVDVVLTRIEYQGGSHGIALATLTHDGRWTRIEAIESPTDSDIAFGVPALRRGDALLTCEPDDRLWHFTRTGPAWTGRELALPPGRSTLCPPPMAIDARASQIVIAIDRSDPGPSAPSLARYREHAGRYVLADELALPAAIETLRFAGDELYVGFQSSVEGALVWALDPALRQPLVPLRRFPASGEPALDQLVDLDVSADRLLLVQLDAAWVLDTRGRSPARALELPPARDGKPRRPQGLLMGSRAVLRVDDQLGVFDLE